MSNGRPIFVKYVQNPWEIDALSTRDVYDLKGSIQGLIVNACCLYTFTLSLMHLHASQSTTQAVFLILIFPDIYITSNNGPSIITFRVSVYLPLFLPLPFSSISSFQNYN